MELNKIRESYRQNRVNRENKQELNICISKLEQLKNNNTNIFYEGIHQFFVGDQAFFNNELNKAKIHLQISVDILKEYPMSDELATAYNVLGIIASMENDQLSSISYFFTVLKSLKELGKEERNASIYNNLDAAYQVIEDYDEAIKLYRLAYEYALKYPYNQKWNCTYVLLNTCITYALKRDLDNAKKYFSLMANYVDEEAYNVLKAEILSGLFLISCMDGVNYQNIKTLLQEELSENLTVSLILNILCYIDYLLAYKAYDFVEYFLNLVQANNCQQAGIDNELNHAWYKYYKSVNDEKSVIVYALKCVEINIKNRHNNYRNIRQIINDRFTRLELEDNLKQIKIESTIDQLTELYNRKILKEVEMRFDMAVADQKGVGLAIIDIDYFKQYNDTKGHLKGDECLRKVAKILNDVICDDYAIRYGGDEFIIVFFINDVEHIKSCIENIYAKIELEDIDFNYSEFKHVTLSCGVFVGIPYDDQSLHDYIRLADRQLYKAKENRNCFYIENNLA